MDSFPIPDSDSLLAQVQANIDLQQEALESVLASIGTAVADSLACQAAGNKKCTSKMIREIKSNLTYQQSKLGSVIDQLMQAIVSLVSEQAVALAQIQGDIPSPGPQPTGDDTVEVPVIPTDGGLPDFPTITGTPVVPQEPTVPQYPGTSRTFVPQFPPIAPHFQPTTRQPIQPPGGTRYVEKPPPPRGRIVQPGLQPAVQPVGQPGSGTPTIRPVEGPFPVLPNMPRSPLQPSQPIGGQTGPSIAPNVPHQPVISPRITGPTQTGQIPPQPGPVIPPQIAVTIGQMPPMPPAIATAIANVAISVGITDENITENISNSLTQFVSTVYNQCQQDLSPQTPDITAELPTGSKSLCDVKADEFLASKQAVMIIPFGLHKGRSAAISSECGELLVNDIMSSSFPVGPILDALRLPNWRETFMPDETGEVTLEVEE